MKTLNFLFLMLVSFSSWGQLLKQTIGPLSVHFSDETLTTGSHRYRALLIGVSKYKNEGPGLQSLDNPSSDAQQVFDLLTTQYTFEPTDVTLLKDPSRQEIIDALDKLANETGESDNVLVFYASHGVWDKQKELGFWLPADADVKSRSAWIANSQIKDYLSDNSIRSKHTLLITDACFGGSIFKSRGVTAENVIRINELYKETSRKAMTSGNLSAVPDKSIFIQQLMKKLGENTDDYLPAQQLFARMYEPIVNNASTNPVYGIIQGAGDGGGDFIFVKRQK